jgi:hypothetical protein
LINYFDNKTFLVNKKNRTINFNPNDRTLLRFLRVYLLV